MLAPSRACPAASHPTSRPATPTPIYLEKGKGSSVWDVDGTEYTDFHGGFGVNVVGPCAPQDRRGVDEGRQQRDPLRGHHARHDRAGRGDLRALPARADAVRQLGHRGHDGRDPRGARRHRPRQDHQDGGLLPRPPRLGAVLRRSRGRRARHALHTPAAPATRPGTRREPTSKGVPEALWDTVVVVPFNDAAAAEEALADNEGQIAAVILEPVMMNIGIVEPAPGYLQALQRLLREARRRADLRRGQVRRHDRLRRHRRALRREAAPGRLRQGDRRRVHDRRLRRRGPLHGVGGQGRRPAGHVQRQPAVVAPPAWPR